MFPGIHFSLFDIQLIFKPMSVITCDHPDHHLRDYRNILDIDTQPPVTDQRPHLNLSLNFTTSTSKPPPHDEVLRYKIPPNGTKNPEVPPARPDYDAEIRHIVIDDPRFATLVVTGATSQHPDVAESSSAPNSGLDISHTQKDPHMQTANHSTSTLVGNTVFSRRPTLNDTTSDDPIDVHPKTVGGNSTKCGCICSCGGSTTAENITPDPLPQARGKVKKTRHPLKHRIIQATLSIRIGKWKFTSGKDDSKKKKKNKML